MSFSKFYFNYNPSDITSNIHSITIFVTCNRHRIASFEDFTAVMFHVEVFRVVTYSVVVGDQRFRRPCCFHLQGEVMCNIYVGNKTVC
jgi:hypothetical protein